MPDGVLMEGGRLVRCIGGRVAMCRHSIVDVADGVAVEMSYARVILVEWRRLEAATLEVIGRYEAQQ